MSDVGAADGSPAPSAEPTVNTITPAVTVEARTNDGRDSPLLPSGEGDERPRVLSVVAPTEADDQQQQQQPEESGLGVATGHADDDPGAPGASPARAVPAPLSGSVSGFDYNGNGHHHSHGAFDEELDVDDETGKPVRYLACEALHRLHQRELAQQKRDLSRELFEDAAAEATSAADGLMRVLHTAILGRLVDRCRFLVPSSELGDFVTRDSLYHLLCECERQNHHQTEERHRRQSLRRPVAVAAATVDLSARRKSDAVSDDRNEAPDWKEDFNIVWDSWEKSLELAEQSAAAAGATSDSESGSDSGSDVDLEPVSRGSDIAFSIDAKMQASVASFGDTSLRVARHSVTQPDQLQNSSMAMSVSDVMSQSDGHHAASETGSASASDALFADAPEQGSSGSDGGSDDDTRVPKAERTFTWRELLAFQFPAFPESTIQQRVKLSELATRPVVSQQDVKRALAGTSGSADITKFLFATGAEVLSGDIFREAVASLGKQPTTVSFAPEYTEHMVAVSRRMATFVPNIILAILVIVFLPLLGKSSLLASTRAVEGLINNEWPTGCNVTDGTRGSASVGFAANLESPAGCAFFKRTLTTMRFLEYDVRRFFQRAAVELLWRDEKFGKGKAVDNPIGSVWPLGGALIRQVRASGDGPALQPCSAANQSTNSLDLDAGLDIIRCDTLWYTLVPFNITLDDALEKTRREVRISNDLNGPTALMLDFSGYDRGAELFLHTRVVVSLPQGGMAFPRYEITPIDKTYHQLVLPILIVQVLSTTLAVSVNLISAFEGRGIDVFDVLRSLLSFSLITGAYVLLRLSAAFVDDAVEGSNDVFQMTFVASGIDTAAQNFNRGVALLGVWALLFMGFLARFLRDVPGLELVVQILRRSAFELACLVAIFATWTLGFVFVAISLFGTQVASVANFTSSSLTILRFFLSEDNYESLVQHSPVLGPAFWFLYQLFVVFFALNLLIAVMTAPLAVIRKDMRLDQDLLDHIGQRLSSAGAAAESMAQSDGNGGSPKKHMADDGGLRRWTEWFLYSRLAMPLVSVAFNCSPLASAYWVEVNDAVRSLYHTSGISVEESVEAAATLIKTLATSRVREVLGSEWNTPLLRHAVTAQLIKGKSSLAFIVAAIAGESNFNVARDARLLVAVYQFNRFNDKVQSVVSHQESLLPLVRETTSRIARKLQLAEKAAAQMVSQLPPDQLVDIVNGEVLVKQGASAAPQANNGIVSPLTAAKNQRRGSAGDVAPDLSAANFTNQTTLVLDAATARELVEDLPPSLVPICAQYNFGKRLIADLHTRGPGRAWYALLVVGLVMWMSHPFLTKTNHAAYLTASLTQGLRDMPYPARCRDTLCNEGHTYEFTYNDVANLDDYRAWVSNVAALQLFPGDVVGQLFANKTISDTLRDVPSTNAAAGVPLLFDPRIRRVSPVYVRQLRAKPRACEPIGQYASPDTPMGWYARIFAEAEPTCAEAASTSEFAGWDESDIGRTSISRVFVPDSALRYNSECIHGQHNPFFGTHATYPCEGHRAAFESASTLISAVASPWLDTQTRFIATSAEFETFGAKVQFSLLLEVGDGGGSTLPYATGFAVGHLPTLDGLYPQRVTYGVLLALHVAIYLVLYCRYLFMVLSGRRNAVQAALLRPDAPVKTLLAFFAYFVIGFGFTATPREQAALQSALMVAHAVVELSAAVIFPLAAIRSRPVRTLVDAVAISVVNCLYVVPLLAIFYAAFILAGIVLFGRTAPQFANGRLALRTVLLGTFGRWDFTTIEMQHPLEAQFYTLAFYACVLIVLANMFLAVVTNASSEANAVAPSVKLAESVLPFFGQAPLHGSFVPFILNASLRLASISNDGKHPLHRWIPNRLRDYERPTDAAVVTPYGRIWFPVECLVPRIRPLRCSMLLQIMHHDRINSFAFGGLIPYILQSYLDFRVGHHVLHAHDVNRNDSEAVRFAESYAVEVVAYMAQRRLLGKSLLGDQEDGSRKKKRGATRFRNAAGTVATASALRGSARSVASTGDSGKAGSIVRFAAALNIGAADTESVGGSFTSKTSRQQ